MKKSDQKKYWKTNLKYLTVLLTIWFIVSYGCGIIFVDELNTIRMGGFKLGFWFAQQGSIYVFTILIFVYIRLMNKLDKNYFEKFPGIRDYMENAKDEAREYGYVKTLFGRKCHVKGIKDRNPAIRGFAERQAINAPIQGSAADIIRRAMIRIPNSIKPIGGSKMLLQVHDELIFEVPEANANELIEIVTTTMQNAAMPAVDISVPLVVEAHAAKNWNDAH